MHSSRLSCSFALSFDAHKTSGCSLAACSTAATKIWRLESVTVGADRLVSVRASLQELGALHTSTRQLNPSLRSSRCCLRQLLSCSHKGADSLKDLKTMSLRLLHQVSADIAKAQEGLPWPRRPQTPRSSQCLQTVTWHLAGSLSCN